MKRSQPTQLNFHKKSKRSDHDDTSSLTTPATDLATPLEETVEDASNCQLRLYIESYRRFVELSESNLFDDDLWTPD